MVNKTNANPTAVATLSPRVHPKEHRISTDALGNALFCLNTLAGALACWYNPQAALLGGILGAVVRKMAGDNPSGNELSDQERRVNRVTLMALTSMAAIYTGTTFVPATATAAAECSFYAPLFLGFEGVTNGLYPLARKLAG